MSLVTSICVACGTVTERLAVVMDPFMDQSYGICEECLAPLHVKMWETLRASLGSDNVTETPLSGFASAPPQEGAQG